MRTFGEVIAEARKKAKLTQRQLAARVKNEEGRHISGPYLNDIEHNFRHPPRGYLLEQFAKELRDPDTLPGERLMALQFLLNFVGDIHDPLYTIEHHDQEGRCIALLLPGAKTPVRLSAYWDDTLVVEAEGNDPAKAAAEIVARLTAADVRKWSSGTPADWAQESHNVAKEIAYSFVKDVPKDAVGSKYAFPMRKGEKDPCGLVPVYSVDPTYRDRALAAVKEQLAKAGVRLAFLLRENMQ